MIEAYVEQVRPIPANIVESVGRELGLDMQPFIISAMDRSSMPGMNLDETFSDTTESIVGPTNSLKECES